MIATPFGLVAAAAAYALRSIIVDTIQLLYLLPKLQINLIDYIRRIRGAVISGLILFGTGLLMTEILSTYSALTVLISAGSVAVSAYFLTLYVMDKQLFVELRGLIVRNRGAL